MARTEVHEPMPDVRRTPALVAAALTVGAAMLALALVIALIVRPRKPAEVEGAAQGDMLAGTAAAGR